LNFPDGFAECDMPQTANKIDEHLVGINERLLVFNDELYINKSPSPERHIIAPCLHILACRSKKK
jgi:hypothetical protein